MYYREMGLSAMKQPGLYVVYAAAVRDAVGVNASPGAVLVQDGKVVMAGELGSLPAELVEQAEAIHRPNDLLLPGLVNAHTHLELTDMGPQPYDPQGGFVGWVQMLRASCSLDSSARRASAERGAMQSVQAGVQAVGDITSEPCLGIVGPGGVLDGVGYLELFGLGSPFDADALAKIGACSRGLQPHAPYSAGPALFERAARSGCPVSCHLAETFEEHRFVRQLEGPFFDLLKTLGKWDDRFASFYGQGLSPVQWMRPYLQAAASDGGWLVAHCNDVSDDDIRILADTNTSVAYCPLASEYFGHHQGGVTHRYRDMLDAGVNVCLGTDSIVGTDPNDPQPLGLLSTMRRLYQRDQTDPNLLLAMATTRGTKALRLNKRVATLQPGAPARFACLPIDSDSKVDPLIQVLTRQDPVEAVSFME